jgi:DNA modification methylase
MSRARIIVGDCRESMAALPEASVDAVVCDPPYEIGFMGKSWDASGIAYDLEVWRQAIRVLKPGGHLHAFSGSRTYHRMTCAIEDAGFEVRDQIMWVYGSGFPKSHDVSKAIDKAAGAEREVVGFDAVAAKRAAAVGTSAYGDYKGQTGDITAAATAAARRWSGWGTALKPAHEPICLARKPLVGTVAANVLRHGTGAINVDGCRVPAEKATGWGGGGSALYDGGLSREGGEARLQDVGRWPANFIHDGSDEATEGLRDAARFFYTAKASSEDRDEMLGDVPRNMHPTVKPTDLMRYLVRMVTPPGGTVLDPFTGSGSTGRAAMLEGMRFIGCELSPEYAEIARARIRFTLGPLFAHEVT